MKREILLILSVFLMLLATPVTANAALTAQYSFDGNLNNSSDSNTPGTGKALFFTGLDGKAISFNGKDTGISVPAGTLSKLDSQLTVAFWQYGSENLPKEGTIFHAVKGKKSIARIRFTLSDGTVYWTAGSDAVSAKPNVSNIKGKWNHWVFTKNAETGEMRIYINGMLVSLAQKADGKMEVPDAVIVGSDIDGTQSYEGLLDDFRIYDEELSPGKVSEIFKGGRAELPNPCNGSNLVKKDGNIPPLSWIPGEGAVSNDVYFGTSYEAVRDATRASAEYKGNQTANTYKPEIQFDSNTTYFWRIDEVSNSGTVKGHVWKFGFDEWDTEKYVEWGNETLKLIEKDYAIIQSNGYYDDHTRSLRAYTWTNTLQLLALSRAAALKPDLYKDRLERLVKYCEIYRTNVNGIWGYDCVGNPTSTNRFYDDNSWMAWALTDAYKATGNKMHLERAIEAYKFALSGEDSTYGGGIWWKETKYNGDPPECKAVSSTSGTALAAARLYEITKEKQYLDDSVRLLTWLKESLRDEGGLIMNDYTEKGVGRNLWSYNTAVPMYAYAVLYGATKNQDFLSEAVSLAKAAEKFWLNTRDGTITDTAPFAMTLAEGWIELYKQTGDSRWLGAVSKVVDTLHDNRDTNGRYPQNWDEAPKQPLNEWGLLYTAPAARIYWVAASLDAGPDEIAKEAGGKSNVETTVGSETVESSKNVDNSSSKESDSDNGGIKAGYLIIFFIVLCAIAFFLLLKFKVAKKS